MAAGRRKSLKRERGEGWTARGDARRTPALPGTCKTTAEKKRTMGEGEIWEENKPKRACALGQAGLVVRVEAVVLPDGSAYSDRVTAAHHRTSSTRRKKEVTD